MICVIVDRSFVKMRSSTACTQGVNLYRAIIDDSEAAGEALKDRTVVPGFLCRAMHDNVHVGKVSQH